MKKPVKKNPTPKRASPGVKGPGKNKPAVKKIRSAAPGATRSPKSSSLKEVFSNLNKPSNLQKSFVSSETSGQDLKYYILYKPYGMMSQFSRENEKPTLADLKFDFQKDAYPVGRLDADSEGLLLLTNDTSLNSRLLKPENAHKRTYLAQVDGAITEEAINQLKKGLTITVDGKPYKTLPSQARIIKDEPKIPERNPPIRVRANIPTSWLEITLIEGKNHQVRKMCAKAGFPVLRLIRIKIGNLTLEDLQPGKVKELSEKEIENLLNN